MKLTFSKTILATMVFIGLTACGSGGGGNSPNKAPTSTPTSSKSNNSKPTKPSVNPSYSPIKSKESSIKPKESPIKSSTEKNQKNSPTTPKTTNIKIEKIDNSNYLFGQATYSGTVNGTINGSPREGTVKLTANFDQKNINGGITFDKSSDYSEKRVRNNNRCDHIGCQRYFTIFQGDYAELSLHSTELANKDNIIEFNGSTSGILYKDNNANSLTGKYQGKISGKNAQNISGSFEATNKEDPRISSSIKGSFQGEAITIPKVVKPVEWEKLPDMPKITPSSISGSGSNLQGKATYASNSVYAKMNKKEKRYYGYENKEYTSTADGNSFIILNADFDKKSIDGLAAFSLYEDTNASFAKIAQVNINFNEATLYKNDDNLTFGGKAQGHLQELDQQKNQIMGVYNGRIYSPYGKMDKRLGIKYKLSSPTDKNILISGSQDLPPQ